MNEWCDAAFLSAAKAHVRKKAKHAGTRQADRETKNARLRQVRVADASRYFSCEGWYLKKKGTPQAHLARASLSGAKGVAKFGTNRHVRSHRIAEADGQIRLHRNETVFTRGGDVETSDARVPSGYQKTFDYWWTVY